ncbi:MAG TPA: site-2 protease family protein [Actinocrinis sp.]|nr:site-2 protease family protein [Actinocrinis sp.]
MSTAKQGLRFHDIPVSVHWSVFPLLGLVIAVLARSVLPVVAAGHGAALYWAAAAGFGAVFLACVFVHEAAHALVARRVGLPVRKITLWVLGGSTSVDGEPQTPWSDLAVAAAGPAASLGCAVVCWAAALGAQALGWSRLLVVVILWLCLGNAVVGVFNLLPGASLDGGRVLRAALWRLGGDRGRAQAWAARTGNVLGMMLLFLGLLTALGGLVGGLWTAGLGLFLVTAARAEQGADRLAGIGLTAAEVMAPDPVCAPGWFTVAAFPDWAAQHGSHPAYPVCDFAGAPVGLLVLADLARIRGSVDAVRVADVTRPLARIPVLAPEDSVNALVSGRAARGGGGGIRALVIEDGRLAGVIQAERFAGMVQLALLRQRFSKN